MNRAYSLDDVLIRPQFSDLTTRREVNLDTDIGNNRIMEHPIISAAMNTITEWHMANEIWKTGGFGIIHRYIPFEERLKQLEFVRGECGVAISSNDKKFVEKVMEDGLCDYFVFDVAHGHMEKALLFGEWMAEEWNTDQYTLIGGNITEKDALDDLAMSGFDGARIGIGEGSVCTTRQVSGVGNPLASSLMELSEIRDKNFPWFRLLVDGGVRDTGGIVKALALGADAIITGYLLNGAEECAKDNYYGMASQFAMEDRGFEDSIHMSAPEGRMLDYDEEVWGNRGLEIKEIIEKLINGIKIGFSYVGARNLTELRSKAKFVAVN